MGRSFDKVPGDSGSVEPSEFGSTEETVEDVAHFVEEGCDVVVTHQGGFVGCWFGEIGDHGGEWVVARAVGLFVAWEDTPYCGMRVLGFYKIELKMVLVWSKVG